MSIELNLANLIFIVIATLSAFWGLAKVIVIQYEKSLDKRFTDQHKTNTTNHVLLEKRLDGIEATNREEVNQWQRVERELLNLKAELPLQYVRREDYIRGQSVIEAKLDGLASKLENVQLRGIINGGKNVHN